MSQTVDSKEFIYEFEKFVLDPNERILLADGKPIHLTDKVFDTLLMLVHHNGRLVTKDEMMSSIWDESFVEEGNLAKNISRLRKILNVNGTSLIETLPRRGYRFAADVKEIDGDTSLLVRRNLRVKITQTEDNEVPSSTFRVPNQLAANPQSGIRNPQSTRLSTAVVAVLLLAVASGLGFYFWKSENKVAREEGGAIRLTDDPADDFWPKWTHDGRIRFFRMGSDKQGRNMLMNPDGTDETEVEVGNFQNWSPDGTKFIFSKPGDKAAVYLANADGSNEIALPPVGNMDWSANSKTIVYQLDIGDDKNSELFTYSIETGKTENVTNHQGFDADPSFSPDGKQIVFASTRDGNAEIYLMNADGSDVRRLTNHPAWDNHPSFSPDGATIAFTADRDNESADIYFMNPDGGNVRRMTDWKSNETVEPGCWSPDSTQIAFFSDREGNDNIYVLSAEVFDSQLVLADETNNLQQPSISPDGKQIVYQAEMPDKSSELRIFDVETKQSRVVTKAENADLVPAFSPDGTRIAFQRKTDTNTEICLINTDGTGLANLTQNPARDGGPAFSPDGRQIAFTSNRGDNTGITRLFVMDADGGNQRQVNSDSSQFGVSPAWSPDGENVVFADDPGWNGNFDIFQMRIGSGEAAKRLTIRPRYDGQPAISPDGKRIAFVSRGDGNEEIYLMNTDGSGLLRLTRNAADDSTPGWSPDGSRIIFSSNRSGKYAIYEIELF